MTKQVPLPHDPDAERAVLSACMLSVEALDEVANVLEPESFYDARHRDIWQAITDVHGANQRVDLVTVAQRLRQAQTLDRAGGTPYLAELSDATPVVAHVEEHAKIVRDKARLRGVIDLCRRAAGEAYGAQDVDAFVGNLEAAIGDVSRSGKIEDTQFTAKELAAKSSADYYERKRTGTQFTGIPTGLHDLDRKLNGLRKGQKYIVAARPGIGKTGFLITVARNVAAMGYGVVFISVEMPADQQIQRVIAQEAMLDTALIESGRLTPQDEARFQSAVRTVASLPLVIDEAPKQTLASIRSAIRRGMRKLRKEAPNIHLGLVVIDYVQLLEAPAGSKRDRSRENELGELSRGTRQIARELKVPLLEASQLNRKCEERPDKRPLLSDLRESGGLEQDAFGILMLYRGDYYRKPDDKPDNTAEVLLRKVRQGGTTGRVMSRFHGPSTGFFDLSADDYDDLPPLNDDF